MTHPAIGSWSDEGAGYEFHFMEQDLDSKRKCMVTPMTFMLQLHRLACLIRQVAIVALEAHSWVRLMIAFLFQ